MTSERLEWTRLESHILHMKEKLDEVIREVECP